MKYVLIPLAIFISFIFQKASAQKESQDPGWQWARLSNVVNEFRSLGIRTNFNNDIYSFCWYIDSIYIEDTAFIHPGGAPGFQDFNLALVKRNSHGQFLKACDFFTPQNKAIHNVDVEIDNESNVIVYGTFSDTLFVNNKIFTVPNDPGTSLFLIKMDSDFNFIWGETIYSLFQDNCGNLDISDDNYIYLTSNHMYNGGDTIPRMANYMGQDSALVGDGLNSLLKINSDGVLIWRREIRDLHIGTADVGNTVYGRDGSIYVTGDATNSIVIEGDTLQHPPYTDYAAEFIVEFDEDGNYHNAFFMDLMVFNAYYHQLEIDSQGNYYITGVFSDSLPLGNDTITLSGDSLGYVIIKMDTSFQPLWFEYIKIKTNQAYPKFKIDLYNDSLAFVVSTNRNFTFAGIDFDFGSNGEVLAGFFDPDGELVSYQTTNTTGAINVFWIRVDNCGNLIFDGGFTGTGYYGADTLFAVNPYSLYLVKNARIQPIILDMPLDTTGCGTITLYAPEGYLYYQWNGVLSNQNWFIVNSSGIVNLKAANEDGCWSEAETIVNIYPVIEFFLGPDTTILLTDTLELNAPGGYENYFWSTGDTTSYMVVPAAELQIGNNLIWLDINNGPCSASDTIIVKVIDNSIIQENNQPDIMLYPNPAETNFQIISRSGEVPETISIYNCDGKRVLKLHPTNNQIEIKSLEHGVYIVELEFQEFAIKRKLIIL